MLNSKDRFLLAFQHKEGDRIPLFEQEVACSVASEILGRKAYTGSVSLHKAEADAILLSENAYQEFLEKVCEDVIDLANALEFDAVKPPWLLKERPTKKLDDYTYLYGSLDSDYWIIRKYNPETETFGVYDCSEYRMNIDDLEKKIEKIEEEYYNAKLTKADFPELQHFIDRCGNEKEIIGFSKMYIPYNPQIWLEAIIVQPTLIERWLDALVEYEKKSIMVQKELGIKVIWGGGDLASTNGVLYGPNVFRKMVLPRLKEICDYCHSLGLYYVFCSDGNLWSIADDLFIHAGVDGYGEIDVDAGMDLKELKMKYGHKITLWGGISCGKTLRLGTKEEVIETTKAAIEAAKAGGGYIFGSSNCIMSGTPIENVFAAFETAKLYGRY